MPDPEPTPQEQQVRDLLAQARYDEPMPSDVVDRLDRVLADLHDGPAAPVADLAAARRRRQRLRAGLVAAAAAVVLGVGVSQLDLTTSGSDDTASSESAADSAASAESEAGGGAEDTFERGPQSAPSAAWPSRRPVVLDSRRLEKQVARLVQDRVVEGYVAADRDNGRASINAARAGCEPPERGGGTWVPAEYDGDPVALVLRPPAQGVRVVDLYACKDDVLLRSVEVPAD